MERNLTNVNQKRTNIRIFLPGAQVNPSVTVAMGVTKRITLLRTVFFILAQCGGAIAGAAFLYG